MAGRRAERNVGVLIQEVGLIGIILMAVCYVTPGTYKS